VSATELPKSPGHPFYVRLNQALEAAGFDEFVEKACRGFCAQVLGLGLIPGRYTLTSEAQRALRPPRASAAEGACSRPIPRSTVTLG
jgi:hypothetical protein